MATSFIDKARIYCRAGKGGKGAAPFQSGRAAGGGGAEGCEGGE